MVFRKYPFIVFSGVAVLGAVAYGAATAYQGEQTALPLAPAGDPVVWAAPIQPALIRELPPLEPAPARYYAVESVAGLVDTFDAVDFSLNAVRRGQQAVPRLLLAALPDDYHSVESVDVRKRLFFKTMLPLVLRVNEEILSDRYRLIELIAILESGRDLESDDALWLERLAERHRTNPGEFATLLRRVDAVSPALAMAQSIEESGWGRSRFARSGNALFGQRVWARGAGIVPHERAEGEAFEVRRFERLIDSVRAYALNLNRHPAYSSYRAKRARLRATEVSLDPYVLADTLLEYSERRESYVDTLKSILKANRLKQFETARLRPTPASPPAALTRLAQR